MASNFQRREAAGFLRQTAGTLIGPIKKINWKSAYFAQYYKPIGAAASDVHADFHPEAPGISARHEP